MSLRLKGRKFSACMLVFLVLVVFVAVNTGQEKTETPNTEKGTLKKNIITEETHPNLKPYVRPVAPDKLDNPEVPPVIPPRESTTEVGTPPWEPGVSSTSVANGQFGSDTYVSDLGATTGNMYDPSLATAPNGNIYCAYERYGSGNPYIRINYSSDGGATWNLVNQIYNASADLTSPTICCTASKVLVLYVVDDGINPPYIEAANAPYGSSTITVRSIGTQYNSDCAAPHVFTDNPCYSYGGGGGSNSAFACWENVFSGTNINISFYRTDNSGDTWKDQDWIIGDTDSYEWRFPHGSFGNSTSHVMHIVCFDKTNSNLTQIYSSAWGDGTDWANRTIATLTNAPVYDCNPSVAASVISGNDYVTACFTNGSADGDDDIGYIHTYNNGSTWYGIYTLTGTTTSHELSAVNYPDQKGNYFHLIYTHWTNKVYYSRRDQTYSGAYGWSTIRQVNDTSGSGWASVSYPIKGLACSDWAMGFPAVAWSDGGYHTPYRPYFNRLYPDDLVGTWTGQGVYYRTESSGWGLLATPATMIAAGDIDNDNTDDVLGIWPAQGGVWANSSTTSSWSLLSSTANYITTGDMNGDGRDDLLGSWMNGVWYRNSATGGWVYMGTTATMLAAGDIDNDGIDDLIGVWPAQGGVWVKNSSDSSWDLLGSTPEHITSGDMNGDGRDDLVGTWAGQGVYYLNSVSSTWVAMATPATMIAVGDLDADGIDDLLGIWPGQGGVWVKYSSTNTWSYISTTADWIVTGQMRGGQNAWNTHFIGGIEPVGGFVNPPGVSPYEDLSDFGPGGRKFIFQSEINPIPQNSSFKVAGPGQPWFKFVEQPNLVPQEENNKKKHEN